MSRNFGDREGSNLRRPPLAVVLVAVLVIAHGEGVGLIVFFASSLVASVVPWRRARTALYVALTAGGLFPLGYLVYGVAVLEAGRDAGIELAERWVLTPLGSAAILGLVGLALALLRSRGPLE